MSYENQQSVPLPLLCLVYITKFYQQNLPSVCTALPMSKHNFESCQQNPEVLLVNLNQFPARHTSSTDTVLLAQCLYECRSTCTGTTSPPATSPKCTCPGGSDCFGQIFNSAARGPSDWKPLFLLAHLCRHTCTGMAPGKTPA